MSLARIFSELMAVQWDSADTDEQSFLVQSVVHLMANQSCSTLNPENALEVVMLVFKDYLVPWSSDEFLHPMVDEFGELKFEVCFFDNSRVLISTRNGIGCGVEVRHGREKTVATIFNEFISSCAGTRRAALEVEECMTAANLFGTNFTTDFEEHGQEWRKIVFHDGSEAVIGLAEV